MRVVRELRLGIGTLIGFNLLISFLAIGLLERLSPSLEKALNENVYSIAATQDMLLVMAAGEASDSQKERFKAALERSRQNVTMAGETAAIEGIERNQNQIFEQNPAAKSELVEQLQKLSAVNIEAMIETDSQVKRLGRAGSWVVAFAGFFMFWLGAVVLRRLRRRISSPIEELGEVLKSWREGEVLRRCRRLETCSELNEAMGNLNSLLDQEVQPLLALANRPEQARGEVRVQKILIQNLIERVKTPLVVLDSQGQLIARNEPAAAKLDSDEGEVLRERLRGIASGAVTSSKVQALPETPYLLCEI